MEISFQNRRLERRFNSERELRRQYGTRMARAISARVLVLASADSLAMIPNVPPERLHLLEGQRPNQFAVDLIHPYRIVFDIDHDPIPRKDDGGIDLTRVTAITIIDVVDYH